MRKRDDRRDEIRSPGGDAKNLENPIQPKGIDEIEMTKWSFLR